MKSSQMDGYDILRKRLWYVNENNQRKYVPIHQSGTMNFNHFLVPLILRLN